MIGDLTTAAIVVMAYCGSGRGVPSRSHPKAKGPAGMVAGRSCIDNYRAYGVLELPGPGPWWTLGAVFTRSPPW